MRSRDTVRELSLFFSSSLTTNNLLHQSEKTRLVLLRDVLRQQHNDGNLGCSLPLDLLDDGDDDDAETQQHTQQRLYNSRRDVTP